LNRVEVDDILRPDGVLDINTLEPFSGLVAFFTTVSSIRNYSVLRFFHVNPAAQISDGRINEEYVKALCEAFSLPYEVLETGAQIHGTHITKAENVIRKHNPETDGLIVSRPGGCAAVFTADCQALILWEPVHRVAAVVHAGWRGAIAGIAGLAVAEMVKISKCRPGGVYAFLGPAISADNFEVGPEVKEAAQAVFPDCNVVTARGGKAFLSIHECNRLSLLNNGVKGGNIYCIEACTYQDTGLFYSYRRDGINAGRMMAAIYILKA
jgi:YfiH family protein